MYKDKKFLAVIMAKSESERIKNKNLVEIGGKSLIKRTVDCLKQAKLVDKIILSTDGEKIYNWGIKEGIECLMEPKSNESNPKVDVLRERFKDYKTPRTTLVCLDSIRVEEDKGKTYDAVLIIQPTSPFRDSFDVDEAIRLFSERDCDALVGVTKSTHIPFWALGIKEGFLYPVFSKDNFTKKSQYFPETYYTNGYIFISSIANLKMTRSLFAGRTIPFVIPYPKSIDIDSIEDLEAAKFFPEKNGL